ncbi:MAG: thioredoxin [Micavibrio aeruginosavorus]|nr:thioredoxin [Micavibrio aeruginosavorus]
MLIGSKKDTAKTPGAKTADIFDVTTADFETLVLQASMDTPVLVDFWAPWCGPCKQLGPMLEAAVTAAGGKVKMAKVNVDENQDLAQAFRVQSIPTVYAFFKGQPVTAFAGARGQGEIKTLIDQLAKMAAQGKPDSINIAETLPLAAKALAAGEIETAQALYAQILAQEEHNVQAYGGLIRSFIAAGDLEQARYMIDDAPEEIAKNPQFDAIRTAVDLAANAPQDGGEMKRMEDALQNNPDDHAMRFDYALALFGAGRRTEAIDALLHIMRRNKTWEDDKARQQLLKFFDAMGPSDPETLAGRRKLSSLLFS